MIKTLINFLVSKKNIVIILKSKCIFLNMMFYMISIIYIYIYNYIVEGRKFEPQKVSTANYLNYKTFGKLLKYPNNINVNSQKF